MKLTAQQIAGIAKLARLQPSKEQMADYQAQIPSILEYVKRLDELETKEGEELAHAASQLNALREDEVDACEEAVKTAIKDNFPQREGDLLKVQAVFEGRATKE